MKGSDVLWWARQYIHRKENYVRYTENGIAAVILCRSHGDWGFVIRGRLCVPILQSQLRCVLPINQLSTCRDVLSSYDERNFVAEYIMRFNSFQFFSLWSPLIQIGDKIFWWENVLTKFMTLSRLRLEFIHCGFNI